MKRASPLSLLLLTVFFLFFSRLATAEEELLPPNQAFPAAVEAIDGESLRVTWQVADGYYLYRSKLRLTSQTEGITLGEPRLPPGKIKEDEFFGKVETYRGKLTAEVPVRRADGAPNTLALLAESQGCADIGVCYPPHRQELNVALPTLAAANDLAGALGFGGDEDEILEPEQAFAFSTDVVDGNTLIARWDIAPGHYLYREKFNFEVQGAEGIRAGTPQIPAGKEKDDEFFGRIQVHYGLIEVRIPLVRDHGDAAEVTLLAGYQGCAEGKICYPPLTQETVLALPAGSVGGESAPSVATGTVSPAQTAQTAPPLSEQDSLALAMASGNTLVTLGTFFGLGLLLAFTPCVFPMIPILSSIIVGQGVGLTTRRAFALSLVYVLAMAATYTIAGVIAGLFGANLQAAFQQPWILVTFSAIFVALAFSMFGFYELQLPSGLQSRLAELSNKQEGGTLAGVAVMGLLSALIVGPCVAPPLMGALIYIGQTGDPWLGGGALFALSLGMGAPLLAIGTSAGKLMPRAGGWMDAVKAVFGVMMLAVAIWMLERILPAFVTMLLWAFLIVVSAIYMGALEQIKEGASGWKRLWKGLGVALLVWGALLLVGAGSGGSDPLSPISHLRLAGGGSGGAAQAAHLEFKRIKTVADLEREVSAARAAGRPVMLDYYADWCVSCKEFEKYTFSDPVVIQSLSGTVLLQADVTANDAEDKALLKHFDLFGPPTIIFYGTDGIERRNFRVVGFMNAESFRAHVENAIR